MGGGRALEECLWEGGGGQIFFFFGAEIPTKVICVPKRTHRVFFAELTEFAAELSEFSLKKQHSSTPRVSWNF